MDERAMSAGRIIERMLDLFRDNAVPIVVAILALAVLGTAWDYAYPDSWLSLPLNIASAVAQYWVIRQVLAREDLLAANLAGAPISYIGVSFLSFVGIMLGFMLLIVPGILLTLRWMPVVPLVLGVERLHTNDALGEAWNRTRGHWRAIGVAYLLTLIPFAGAVLAWVWQPFGIVTQLAALGVANILFNLGMALSWMLSVSVYQGFATRERELEGIFA